MCEKGNIWMNSYKNFKNFSTKNTSVVFIKLNLSDNKNEKTKKNLTKIPFY